MTAESLDLVQTADATEDALRALFSSLTIRGMTLRNRIVLPPMCTYSAKNGMAGSWHWAHLSKFVLGGFGLITVEATAIEETARITHGDLGIWSDDHIEPLKWITSFAHEHRAKASLQIAHAGRKSSMQRPWDGNGPMDGHDEQRGEKPWQVVGVTREPVGPGWLIPHELTKSEISSIVLSYARAAQRAVTAGFDAVEIHGAHGYLIHTFLSPLTNKRTDEFGDGFEGRARLAIEVAKTCRNVLPDRFPLFFKISSIDWENGGWAIGDSVNLARLLKAQGVDVIVCSSGGLSGPATASTAPRSLGYQVEFAEQVKRDAQIHTEAVGLIIDAVMAGQIIDDGRADLIGIGRQALFDPFWPLHEIHRLSHEQSWWNEWSNQYGWWLSRREGFLGRLKASR